MQRRQYKSGEFILKESEAGQEAYRILAGKVEIYVSRENEKIILGHLGPDEVFGEMGMIGDKPRSANAVAIEPTEVEVITPQEFNAMILSDPNKILPYLKSFFERLRRVTDTYATLVSHQHHPSSQPSDTKTSLIRLKAKTDYLIGKIPKQEIVVQKFPFRIGRWSENFQADVFVSNDLLIRDEKPFMISRNHCAIEKEGNRFFILDRGSSFGTRVNGKLIGGGEAQVVCPLNKGENEVQLGKKESPFIFELLLN